MLGHDPFSHNILRKYQAVFGTIFNDLKVVRRDANGAVQQTVDVPLSYARKEKILARLEGDPDLERNVALVLPRMSYEMTAMSYDGERKLRSTGRHVTYYANTAGQYGYLNNPVPYDLEFNVYVYAAYHHDGNQIVEQILPFFQPQFDVTIELIEGLVTVDAPIYLRGSPEIDDTYDGEYSKRRSIVWTLPFTMKAYLYGPVKTHPLIKFANVTMYDATIHDDILDAVGNSAAVDRVTVQPGQLANGSATTNAALTVPYSQIEKNEQWGYVITIYGNLDEYDGTGGE